jgi:hypothetical protein
MNTFQWIMIGVAAVIVAPVIWKKLVSLIPEREEIINPKPLPQPKDEKCDGLVAVVERWDNLKQCCANQGMTKAVEELQKIFPLFVDNDERQEEDE